MQIKSEFTIAVHILTAIDYFRESYTVTSSFLAGSIGANPVIVRNVMLDLKEAGLISTSQGRSGIELARKLSDITLLDVYNAVSCVNEEGLFHFHENPNADCPVGRNIHRVMAPRLSSVQAAMEEELRKTTLVDIVEATKAAIENEN